MKYYSIKNKKVMKEAKLIPLDKVLYEKCKDSGMNISRLIKAGKPYSIGSSKYFATTQDIVDSISRLQRLGLLERR